MAKITVEIKGLRQLGEAMRTLSADVSKKVARAGTAAAAQVIRKSAISKAPVETGNLRKNIILKRLPASETRLTSEHIVTVRRGVTKKQKQAGLNSADYARFLEHGTVHMPAQPFLRPAFDQNKGQAVVAMASRIKARIDKAKRAAKK